MASFSRDAPDRIERFNAGREAERLALKYREMCKSPFAFFRGTAHLFWEDISARSGALPGGPPVWACGDLHFENFGSFQGDNGLSYFDLNDFDEAALAPATWEVSRFVASAYVAAPSLNLTRAKITELVESFLDTYQTALGDGKARWIERATATGMVRTLLRRVSKQTRAMLLNSRTTMKKGKRRIRIDGRHALPITESQRTNVPRRLDNFAKSQPDPDFFRVLDVARRVAGLGSLGLERYIVLVRGDRDGNAILDVKQAAPSSLARFERLRQPAWKSEADRVVAVQQRMQAVAPALLHAKKIGRGGYVLHELQPTSDRLSLDDARGNPRHLRSAARAMGRVTAWAQLRSSGRQGSATADDLIAFAGATSWKRGLIDFGRRYATQVQRDYKQFVDARRTASKISDV
ncbi:MAG TPA: DUF2252 domain-containing protein [Gemmatimonadaceae bacterium]|nr:DUF2252 domain-containing protein [Gemmatimonadaceae bacterium]